MRRRHDPFLKLFYRAAARDAITLFFPELAAHIDWGQLEWIEKEVPIRGERPRSIVADLVGRTRDLEGRYLEVLIHPEIQMQVPADMGWRALQYGAGLLLQQGNPNTRVLTFVFYHCGGAGGVHKERHALEYYGHSILEATYWVVGLGDLEAEAYAESDNPAAWALAAWMRQQRPGRVELRLRLVEKILRFVRDEEYRRLLLDAVRSYFTLSKAEQAEEERLLQSRAHGEVNEMLQTELGRLEERARREGRQEGEEQARQQMQEALQRALMGVVESRFAPVPESLAARIRQVEELSRLEELIVRAAAAVSLEEIERLLAP
jgi:hypothetical protein